MGTPGIAANVVGLGVGGSQFLRGRENALIPHYGHRVIFAGVAAGNVMQAGGGNGRRRLPGVAGDDGVNAEALVVPQQHRQLVVILRGVQGNQAVALGVVHIDDIKGKALAEPGQHQPAAIHRVGKTQEHGQVIGPGAALVRRQHHKGLGRAQRIGLYRVMVKLHLGHGRAGPPDVAGGGVGQQILAGPVQAVLPGNVRGFQESGPGELVNLGVVRPPGVGGGHTDVVPGMPHIAVNQQAAADGCLHRLLGRVHHALGGLGVAADGAHIGFQYGNGEFHNSSLLARVIGSVGIPSGPDCWV